MDALEELDDAIDPEWTEDDPDLQQILARIDELELDEGIDLDADPLDDPELLPPGQEVEVEVDEEDPASEKILTHGQGEKSERQGKKVVKKLVRDLTRRQKKKVAVLNMASRARSLILVVS